MGKAIYGLVLGRISNEKSLDEALEEIERVGNEELALLLANPQESR